MTQRTRIKICGITREIDLANAVEAGADALGFVFYERSPRAVTISRAADLARQLPPFVTPVGLFVNAESAQIEAAVQAIPGLILQFHGDESTELCQHKGRPYLRAVRMAPGVDLLNCSAQYPDAQGLLLDAHVEGYGGGGKVFDWSLIANRLPLPVILSGGLNSENVIDGILQVRPWAVDVSSGVEQAKGIKDASAMRRFCEAVREADARIAALPT